MRGQAAALSALALFVFSGCPSDPREDALRARSETYHQRILSGDPGTAEFTLAEPGQNPDLRRQAIELAHKALQVAFSLVGRPSEVKIQDVEISKQDPNRATVRVLWRFKKKDGTDAPSVTEEHWVFHEGAWYLAEIKNES